MPSATAGDAWVTSSNLAALTPMVEKARMAAIQTTKRRDSKHEWSVRLDFNTVFAGSGFGVGSRRASLTRVPAIVWDEVSNDHEGQVECV